MFAAPDIALNVSSVSKIYSRKRSVMQRRLSDTLRRVVFGRPYDPRAEQLRDDEFYAVSNVSFSLRRGEAIGIIGLNGSGKTTLLRLLAGQLLPDGGEISVIGRTASMIDLTAGFQTAASGRDNVFLRGAALGRSREQMLRDFDSIVEFSELGDAIDAPIASYSSGMMMRLAFSILAASQPDVLFIDEVLAVGDFRFRQKCLARVREMREHCAFVMVSHSMPDIARFCDSAIVLAKGKVAFTGDPSDAVKFYQDMESTTVVPDTRPKLIPADVDEQDRIGDVSVRWEGANDDGSMNAIAGAPAILEVSFDLKYSARNPQVGIPVYEVDGRVLTAFSTEQIDGGVRVVRGHNNLRLKIDNLPLNPGRYRAAMGIVDGTEFLYMRMIGDLVVTARDAAVTWGVFTTPYKWESRPTT